MKHRHLLAGLLSLVLITSSHAQTTQITKPTTMQSSYKFNFGKEESGFTTIMSGTDYSPGKYGFDLGQSPFVFDQGGAVGNFGFSCEVPDGNYRVTVILGSTDQTSSTSILAEARRLMVGKIDTKPDETQTVSFIVNYRNYHLPPLPKNAPGGTDVRLYFLDNEMTWDNKLTLWFCGSNPAVQSIQIEPVQVPTVFLVGDSTVCDQSRDPGASWGQMLPYMFKDEVAVANYATSGQTMKSFLADLRFEKVLSQAKKGDYLFLQFGHNDQKAQWPQTYAEASTTYKTYLKVFVDEAKRHGMTPVLVSPMERRQLNSLTDHARAMKEFATQEKIAFIDNWTSSQLLYKAMGADLDECFGDMTHHKNYGAYEIARLVAAGIKQNNLDLAKSVKDDYADFDPNKPDTFEAFSKMFTMKFEK